MKSIAIPFIILYRIYFALIFFVVLLILYPIFWVLLLNKKNFKSVFKLKVFTARVILFFDFIYLKKIEPIPTLEDKPYVICANHASYLDIILMYLVLPKNHFLFIGKSELLKWPIISIFFKKLDISVDRNSRTSGMRSIIRAKEEIQNGWSIVIFPEGGIHDKTPELSNFKNGAFKLAIDSETAILPVTILDNWKLFSVKNILTAPAQPGFSRIIIHTPIPTSGMTKKDLIPLRKQTYDTINSGLRKHNKTIKN